MQLIEAPLAKRSLMGLWLIFALSWLTGCGSVPEPLPITCETQIVEVEKPVYRPLPDELVEPLSYPPELPERFTVLDTMDHIYYLYDTLDLANSDRSRAGRITRGENDGGSR